MASQDGSNQALKRITLSIAREKEEPHLAFTNALLEVSSLQQARYKRVVAYKGFYVDTDNFESTGCVHLCILLEWVMVMIMMMIMMMMMMLMNPARIGLPRYLNQPP
jgi:hypothetical protein